MNSLQKEYLTKVKPALLKKFNYSSIMQVPRIEKIVINMTAGRDVSNSKAITAVHRDLAIITGQKPYVTHAKKSLASFKLREGMPMGGKVTLRRDKMWDFLQKLIRVAIPRIRDFRGVSATAFDNFGNYALGVKEHIIFPEIDYDKIDKTRGLDVIIVTSGKTKEESKALLSLLGMPFKKERNNG